MKINDKELTLAEQIVNAVEEELLIDAKLEPSNDFSQCEKRFECYSKAEIVAVFVDGRKEAISRVEELLKEETVTVYTSQ